MTVLTFDNFASSNSYGVEVVTSLDIQDWVRGNVTLNAYRGMTDASNVDTDLSNDAMAYTSRANLTFSLTPGLDMQISQYYCPPMDIAGGRIGERLSSDIAVRQEILDGKGSLSVRASDVFDTMNFNIQRSTDQFDTRSTRNWNQRQVMVTFSYSFSGGDRGSSRQGRGEYR